jgi:hypothetical protein
MEEQDIIEASLTYVGVSRHEHTCHPSVKHFSHRSAKKGALKELPSSCLRCFLLEVKLPLDNSYTIKLRGRPKASTTNSAWKQRWGPS